MVAKFLLIPHASPASSTGDSGIEQLSGGVDQQDGPVQSGIGRRRFDAAISLALASYG
ncbi:MAG: hypothetical protein HC804_03510 [Anaerolineae bacterium]|nr:hypothetical protein [Anaerolineae bacterium]